jgi:hypothetical protein
MTREGELRSPLTPPLILNGVWYRKGGVKGERSSPSLNHKFKFCIMENIVYEIETHDGEFKKFDKRSLKDSIDDLLIHIAVLKKTFMLNKKKHYMTLFSVEHSFTAQEYIQHYKSLSSETYGKDFMSQFDETVIGKLNY